MARGDVWANLDCPTPGCAGTYVVRETKNGHASGYCSECRTRTFVNEPRDAFERRYNLTTPEAPRGDTEAEHDEHDEGNPDGPPAGGDGSLGSQFGL